MTTTNKTKNLLKLYPALRRGIQKVKQEVLGQAPQLNHRTGYNKVNKKQLTAIYLDQYYEEPIAKAARTFIPGYMTELEERRSQKLAQLRRQGKGPPKKGAGARSKKK